jgi:hypothetical protein
MPVMQLVRDSVDVVDAVITRLASGPADGFRGSLTASSSAPNPFAGGDLVLIVPVEQAPKHVPGQLPIRFPFHPVDLFVDLLLLFLHRSQSAPVRKLPLGDMVDRSGLARA